jgi:hypothetical protein
VLRYVQDFHFSGPVLRIAVFIILLGVLALCFIHETMQEAKILKILGPAPRFAQEALGHNSVAVHRAYAKKAKVKLPSLEEYEARTGKD